MEKKFINRKIRIDSFMRSIGAVNLSYNETITLPLIMLRDDICYTNGKSYNIEYRTNKHLQEKLNALEKNIEYIVTFKKIPSQQRKHGVIIMSNAFTSPTKEVKENIFKRLQEAAKNTNSRDIINIITPKPEKFKFRMMYFSSGEFFYEVKYHKIANRDHPCIGKDNGCELCESTELSNQFFIPVFDGKSYSLMAFFYPPKQRLISHLAKAEENFWKTYSMRLSDEEGKKQVIISEVTESIEMSPEAVFPFSIEEVKSVVNRFKFSHCKK